MQKLLFMFQMSWYIVISPTLFNNYEAYINIDHVFI
jgi:hypothetical protein